MLDPTEAIQMMTEDAALSAELPPELSDLVEEMRLAKQAKIEQIGKLVAKHRDEAVKGRKQSGIEEIWQEDEEYYAGIDDANRGNQPWLKSASVTGGISRTSVKSPTRCTAFFNITRQFVDSAAARMGDILLPSGDWNFTIKPTPVQDPVRDVTEEIISPEQAEQDQKALQKQAQEKCAKGELQIRDWLVECAYHAEVRKVLEDSAKVGVGILKGPVPDRRVTRVTKSDPATKVTSLEIGESIVPVSKRVDYWDAFPDPNCGDDIQNGAFFVERDRMTARQLKALKALPGYLADQIDEVLEEGPGKCHYEGTHRVSLDKTKDDDRFEVWYYHGLIDIDKLDAMGVDTKVAGGGKHTLPAVVTLVNDRPIKAFLNPLDTGEFPYDVMPWQRVPGQWAGIGVSRQMRTPQDMLNAAGRALMDNAGLASGPQIILRQNAVTPADGKWEITPRKIWYATEQADVRSVADAFNVVQITMVQAELNGIIELAFKMAEDATGISYLLQGQQGAAPDTVGGMELLNRNASAILRRLARTFDECVTEKHIRRYYDYLLQYGPDECKGDVRVEALGSTALVERDVQAMESMALLQMSVDPRFGLDPEKAIQQVLVSKRMLPDKWLMDEEKKKQLAAQPPPEAPAVTAAKIKAESDVQVAQIRQAEETKRRAIDVDRDTVYVQSQTERDRSAAVLRREELEIKRDLAMLEYANKRDIALDEIKASLAKEAMKLKTQKELAGLRDPKAARQVATPAVEPPQRAPAGQAFQQ